VVVTKKAVGWLVALGVVVTFIIFGALVSPSRPNPAPTFTNRICEDSFKHDVDLTESKETHIEVVLTEGCWSGFIHLPKYWNRNDDGFNVQSAGNQDGAWAAFWFASSNHADGPYGPNLTQFYQDRGTVLRVQGHGKIVFFTHKSGPDQ
jgi:hypothetical protein